MFEIDKLLPNDNLEKGYRYADENFIFAHVSRSDKPVFSEHIHEYYEIILFMGNNAKYISENQITKCKQYDVLITPPLQYHYIQLHGESTEYERYNILIKNEALNNLLDNKPLSVINIASNKIVFDMFERFDYYIQSYYQKISDEKIKLLITSITKEILINLSVLSPYDSFKPLSNNTLFNDIINYISTDMSDIGDISDIAAHFYISVNYIVYNTNCYGNGKANKA